MARLASARQNRAVYSQIAKQAKIHKSRKWATEVFQQFNKFPMRILGFSFDLMLKYLRMS